MDFSFGTTIGASNRTRVGFQNEPDGRGTLGILVPCTATLLVCSWSVMHLNIPSGTSTTFQRLIPYCYWCFIVIVGPELAIWAAWRQLLSAKALRKEFEIHQLDPRPFTVAHGFYAAMGGYVFDFEHSFGSHHPKFAKGISRLYLTPKGVALLARCGHLPKLTEKEIVDKGKEDELGKAITVVQASWMIFQVMGRLALGLPITLLEVTVVGHVLCALVLCAMWWHKPRKVEEPTILEGEWCAELAAFMMMSSHLRRMSNSNLPSFSLHNERPEISDLQFYPKEVDQSFQIGSRAEIDTSVTHDGSLVQPFYVRSRSGRLKGLFSDDLDLDMLDETSSEDKQITRARCELGCKALHRYSAARLALHRPVTSDDDKYSKALAMYPEMPEKCKRRDEESIYLSSPAAWLECRPQDLVSVTSLDWPHDGLLRTTGGLVMGTTLWIASIAFSSIHIAAWNSTFPTSAEALLWRASSVYIGISGLLWAALHVLAEQWAGFWWKWYDVMTGECSKALTLAVALVCSACGLLYILARAYLIIEGYVELRSLPAAAYIVPQWTLAVPHLS